MTALVALSCTKRADKLPSVEINGTEIPDLDPDLLTPIDVKLSQIAENLKVINLETTPECILGSSSKFQIGDKYIIVRDDIGIFQFSIEGNYIRKLVTYGRGPGETSSANNSCLVELEDLYIVVTKNDIYRFKLSTGEFLGKDGKPFLNANESLIECVYIGDSKILYSYNNNGLVEPDSSGCGVKIQELGGDVLWHKKFDYNSMRIMSSENKYKAGSKIFLLSTDLPEEFILQVEDQDTVYKLNTGTYSLEPTLLKRFEKVKLEGIPVSIFAKNCTYENPEYARINGYQLVNYTSINELSDDLSFIQGDRYYTIYDDNKKIAYRVGVFENDYFGFFHETIGDRKLPHYFPALLGPNGKLVESYDAFPFLQFASEALENPELDPTVRTRLLDLTGKVTETSNPVLLIGDMKKKIDL